MALINCRECGHQVSNKAERCPHCGAKPGNYMGAGGIISLVVILFIVGIFFSSNNNPSKSYSKYNTSNSTTKTKQKTVKTYAENQSFHVGYMSYGIWRSWWQNQLRMGNNYDDPPNAKFLFVDLTAKNHDVKERTIPPFKLIDENGAEYGTYNRAYLIDNALGLIESLNPEVQKQGIIVFDVPTNHTYRLKVDGGYWSTDEAYVKLTPEAPGWG